MNILAIKRKNMLYVMSPICLLIYDYDAKDTYYKWHGNYNTTICKKILYLFSYLVFNSNEGKYNLYHMNNRYKFFEIDYKFDNNSLVLIDFYVNHLNNNRELLLEYFKHKTNDFEKKVLIDVNYFRMPLIKWLKNDLKLEGTLVNLKEKNIINTQHKENILIEVLLDKIKSSEYDVYFHYESQKMLVSDLTNITKTIIKGISFINITTVNPVRYFTLTEEDIGNVKDYFTIEYKW